MTHLHPALRPELVARLRHELTTDVSDPPPAPGTSPLEASPLGVRDRLSARAKDTTRRLIRRSLGWYVEALVRERTDAATEELERRLRLQEETRAQSVNLELLKGEVRGVLRTLDDLGAAIAPGTGLEGVAPRIAEQREKLHGLDRRLRHLENLAPQAVGDDSTLAVGTGPDEASPPVSNRFDYMGFERRFRGDPEAVTATLMDRYSETLRRNQPVLDVGCGRGDFVDALSEAGIEAAGVEIDPAMVADALSRGRSVEQGDALEVLCARPPASLGAVVAVQVVEHLSLGALLELLELSLSRLRPEGVLLAETPNPQSLVVLGNSYVLDPTHVRPLHPSLLAFLCESAGFRHVELGFYEPALDYHLPLVDDPDAPAWVAQVNEAVAKLNRVLFGPQDYSVTATAPPA